jgi:hypothetical protein
MSQSPKQIPYYRRLLGPGAHWVWLSTDLYIVACFLPAMPPIWGSDPIYGWECLASLIIGIPAWWANPAYFLALIFHSCHCGRIAAVLAALAALLACSFELMDLPNQGWMLKRQEVGCYLWIMSLQILACNLIWREWLRWRERQEQMNHGVGVRPSPDGVTPAT